jgi:hypothetical protein
MEEVLRLDPQNADANRAIKMLDEVLQPKRPWWKVW